MRAIDAIFFKKNYEPVTTELIISKEKMKDTMKIVKSLEESSLLMKPFSETIKNRPK